MKYRVYIDEVGNQDLESSDNPNHRFLSLTGVIVELGYVERVLHPQLEQLKAAYFHQHPDDPIILHRKEMLSGKPPFHALADKNKRAEFDQELLALLSSWEYSVVSVCLDKKAHKETYTTWRYDPYHYCLAVLLERYVFFLNQKNGTGDVMAESRGGKEDMRLKKSYAGLWANGTDYVDQAQFKRVLTSKQLKVKKKDNNIAGLQLADILAHPSRNEILHENGLLDKTTAQFANRIITILKTKYYQRRGKIYGKKLLSPK